MFADVLVPPTFFLDWYRVGFPAGLIAFLAVLLSIATMGIVLARRSVPLYVIIPLSIFLFVVADLGVYYVGKQPPRPRSPAPVQPIDPNADVVTTK